ncbi:MAG: alpha-hydroxy acid oxidase [Dehalococcoidia bacterium]
MTAPGGGSEAAPRLNVFDFERAAGLVLPPRAFDYYASGAHDELTLRDNREAFDRIRLRPRALRGVANRSMTTTILGREHASPLLVAPMAFARMAHAEGELAIARAARDAGVTMTLSTLATTSLEDVAASTDHPLWYQLYVFRNRDITRGLVERAERAGYEALVVTVDAPLLGRREADERNAFQLPPGLEAANLVDASTRRLEGGPGQSGLSRYFAEQLDQGLTWDGIDWLRSITKLPVLVKGIVRSDDAALAVEHGVAGVIVSNHGGRQLDTAIASIDALPEVVDAVAGRAAVLVDGGIRRGTDILKAVALGADAVLVGRPVMWGLAVEGEAGARAVLRILLDELDLAMALAGSRTLEEVTPDLIAPRV